MAWVPTQHKIKHFTLKIETPGYKEPQGTTRN
jgi:hypothetical protein